MTKFNVLSNLRRIKYNINFFFLEPLNYLKSIISDYKKIKYFKSLNNKNIKNVWIIGLPKSGTTLIEEIMDNLNHVNMSKSPLIKFYESKKDRLKNNIDFENFKIQKYKNLYLKSHTCYSKNLNEFVNSNNIKVIISTRNLKDMMISRYYHILNDKTHWCHKHIKYQNKNDGFLQSLKIKDKLGNVPLKYYQKWINDWEKNIDNNFLKLDYEEFITNKEKYIDKIIEFLHLDSIFIGKSILVKLNENLKNEKLNFNQRLRSFKPKTFRVGTINNWEDFFNDEIAFEFNKLLNRKND